MKLCEASSEGSLHCFSFHFSQKILTVSLFNRWKAISRAAGKRLEIVVIVSITASDYQTEFEESFLYLENRSLRSTVCRGILCLSE